MQISPFYYFNADDSKKRQEVQTFEDYFTKELVPIRCDEESIVDSSESSTLLGLFPFHLAFHVHVNNPKATSGTSSSLREAPPNINGTTSLYFIENEALPTKRFSYLHGPGSLAFLGSSKSFTKLSSSYSRKNQQNLHEVGSPCFLEGDTTLMPILAKFQAFKHRYSVHLKGQVMQFKKNTWLIKGTIFRAKEHIGFFYQVCISHQFMIYTVINLNWLLDYVVGF